MLLGVRLLNTHHSPIQSPLPAIFVADVGPPHVQFPDFGSKFLNLDTALFLVSIGRCLTIIQALFCIGKFYMLSRESPLNS
jgi:hypothetical protein